MWCKERRANDWIIRLNVEYLNHLSSLFVTLTYDDEHLPHSPTGFPIINKHDLQLFFRYLRRRGYVFKYFAVSEYGPTSLRPHYHIIMFGLDALALQDIAECWKGGFVSVYPVRGGSINYVSRYSLMHAELPGYLLKKPYKPFMICSKGIGKSYVEDKDVVNFHIYNMETSYNMNGYTKSLPRYYRDKIFVDDVKETMSQNWLDTSRKYRGEDAVQRTYHYNEWKNEYEQHKLRYDRFVQKVKNEFTKKSKI